MSSPTASSPTSFSAPLILRLGSALAHLTDTEFLALCQLNRDLRMERTANGDLIIRPPTGGNTGRRSLSLSKQLGNWIDQGGGGIGFDSSTGFRLPNGAKRSPDVAWVRRERWEALTEHERDEFPPLAPDFVVELRSRSDSLDVLRAKLCEYVEQGVRLGWLLDPVTRTAEVYRQGQPMQVIHDPDTLRGDPELPGFELDLRDIW